MVSGKTGNHSQLFDSLAPQAEGIRATNSDTLHSSPLLLCSAESIQSRLGACEMIIFITSQNLKLPHRSLCARSIVVVVVETNQWKNESLSSEPSACISGIL